MEPTQSKEEKRFPMTSGAAPSGTKMKPSGESLTQKLEDFDLGEQVDSIKDTAKGYYDKTESVIKDHPFYAVMGAAAIGYLAGAIFNRRH